MDYRERREEMVRMKLAGKTLREIGEVFGVSRERVRQITIDVKTPKKIKVKLSPRDRDIKRFYSRLAERGDCIEWVGCVSPTRYGRCRFLGREEYAHRVSYIIHKGAIPDDMWVLHTCDNPSCVNPYHLYLGTPKDNSWDRESRGRGNRSAKLSLLDIQNIRERYARGDITQRELGAKYSIHIMTVSQIINGRYKRVGLDSY